MDSNNGMLQLRMAAQLELELRNYGDSYLNSRSCSLSDIPQHPASALRTALSSASARNGLVSSGAFGATRRTASVSL